MFTVDVRFHAVDANSLLSPLYDSRTISSLNYRWTIAFMLETVDIIILLNFMYVTCCFYHERDRYNYAYGNLYLTKNPHVDVSIFTMYFWLNS